MKTPTGSNPRRGAAGNFKMRGKKCMDMGCGCCVAFDFRDMMLEQEQIREIKDYFHGKSEHESYENQS